MDYRWVDGWVDGWVYEWGSEWKLVTHICVLRGVAKLSPLTNSHTVTSETPHSMTCVFSPNSGNSHKASDAGHYQEKETM